MSLNALELLRESGIGIASDTPEYLKIGEFHPQDATTNPSLVFAATENPNYAHIIEEAVRYAIPRRIIMDDQVDLAADYVLVQFAIQILNIIPGRVSVSVDPRLAYDHDAIVTKSRNIVSIFEEFNIHRDRILLKIPATYPGILAAQTLENHSPPIHTNATLIFSLVQALACAQAGLSVISPFIGRVKDWWTAHHTRLNGGTPPPPPPLSLHPGILLVRDIRSAFALRGYTTQILAAGFREVEEIVEVGRGGPGRGPDMVTLPPDLLLRLRNLRPGEARERDGLVGVGNGSGGRVETQYIAQEGQSGLEYEAAYQRDLEKEMVAVDKVPEGIAKFSADAERLEDRLREEVRNRIEPETPSQRQAPIS